MLVSLVYPGIGGKGFDSIGQGMDSGWIGHGLGILAACARHAGHQVNLIDLRALNGWDSFRRVISERAPDVTAITMMSVDYDPAMRCLEIIREVSPRIVTVVGGPHPTIMPDELIDHPCIDHIFLGEAEETFPDALNRLKRGEAVPRIVPGTHPDLDRLPYVDHSLFIDEWRRQGYEITSPEAPFVEELPPPFLTIIAGRGCKYNCSYCQPAERMIFGRQVRRRSVENVLAELRMLQEKYHFASFMFHDDCLTEDCAWVVEFCRQRPGFALHTQGHHAPAEYRGGQSLPQVRRFGLGQLYAGHSHRDQGRGHGDDQHAERDRPRLLQPGVLHASSWE